MCEHDDHQITVFDKEQLDKSSTPLRCFNYPIDLTTDEKGTLYVADSGIHRVHVLTDGQVIQKYKECSLQVVSALTTTGNFSM